MSWVSGLDQTLTTCTWENWVPQSPGLRSSGATRLRKNLMAQDAAWPLLLHMLLLTAIELQLRLCHCDLFV